MSNGQNNEFETFGIVNKALKSGILLGLLSLSITANIILVNTVITMQGDLYEKILTRVDTKVTERVDNTLEQPVANINRAVERVDTAVNISLSASKTADSAGKFLLKQDK